MKHWFASREPRERLALTIGVLVVLAALLYGLLWHPLHRSLERNRAQVQEQRRTLAWMERAAAEVAALRQGSGTDGGSAIEGSLVSHVERSARDAGLAGHIARMEPTGAESVRVAFEAAPFDALVAWLAGFADAGQPQPTAFQATRGERPGLVNAAVTLERPSPATQP